MAEKRRLQGDIDRTLKKVCEGRATFKETLDKFESATNHTQKEKHEADLKKDIKKLQRFRDSIKTWLTSPDVKDKVVLTDIRKLIESDMERFKVIEKETKTKAYSKEGLFSDQKRDPAQKEKDELQEWLRNQISKFQKRAETCDFDMHNINAKRKRNADRDRMGELSQRLGMYRSHIAKQEILLRLLDNDKIELEKVRDLRFQFEEFLSNPDQEIYKSDQGMFMYDELNLDQLFADLTIATDLELSNKETSVVAESLGFSVTPVIKEISSEILPAPVECHDIPRLIVKDRLPNKPKHRPDPPKTISITSTPMKSSIASLDAPDYLLTHNLSDSSIKDVLNDSSMLPTLNVTQPLKTITTPVLESVSYIESQPPKEMNIVDVVKSTVIFPDTYSVLTTTANTIPTLSSTQEPLYRPKVELSLSPQFTDSNPVVSSTHNTFFDIPNNFTPLMQQQPQNEMNYSHVNFVQRAPVQSLRPVSNITMNKDNTFDMILEPGDAMSPFRNHNFQSNDVYNNQVIAMEHGRLKQPLSSDSEKARMIIYKNEMSVPDFFPREPVSGSDTEEYYMRLDSDTLFFIFYYFEGTKAQYLAAKVLKRMSWRFHTGHMCWFQRHEEPKQITDNSESGTYIFYDFESMSRQKKENFTFSYNFLEDKDF